MSREAKEDLQHAAVTELQGHIYSGASVIFGLQ